MPMSEPVKQIDLLSIQCKTRCPSMNMGMPFIALPSPMPGPWQVRTMAINFIMIMCVFTCQLIVDYLSRMDGNHLVQVLLLAPRYGQAISHLSMGRHAPSHCY